MEKKANRQANIVRITEIKEHTNADSLELIILGAYQVVSRKGQFKVGDLAVYIQPDSVVPQTEPFRFIWEPYLNDVSNDPMQCRHIDPATGPLTVVHLNEEVCLFCGAVNPFKVPEKKRRITVRKFRGEWSEGLLLPVSDFTTEFAPYGIRPGFVNFTEGTDVSDILGITHYDPDKGKESTFGENSSAPKARKKGYPRSVRGWYNYITRRIKQFLGLEAKTDGSSEAVSLGIPVYDVDAWKNYKNVFVDGELVKVTEKIHGSNARYIFLDGVMYAGSRALWKSANSNCIWRNALKENPWIEDWCRAHEGYVLWGEVTPTQGGYEYGSKKPQFFAFDVRTPDGKWLDESTPEGLEILTALYGYSVPTLYKGPFNLEKIMELVDGPSTIKGAKNMREGVVIKTIPERHVHGLGRAQLKIVSNKFLEKDNK